MVRDSAEPQRVDLGDVLAAVDIGVFALDAFGRVVAANHRAQATLGLGLDELVGRLAHEVLHADVDEPAGCTFDRALLSERTVEVENDVFRTCAGLLPVSWLASHLHDRTGLAVVFRDDTTQRARAVVEAAEREQGRVELSSMQQSVAELRWLAGLSEAMSATLDEKAAVSVLATALASRMADVVLADLLGADGSLTRVGGFTADGVDPVTAALIAQPEVSDAVPARSASLRLVAAGDVLELTREQIATPGTLSDTSRILLLALGVQRALIVPLFARSHMVGAVALVRRLDRPFTEVERTVSTDLARRAALAIDNAQLYRAQRDAAVQLQQSLLPQVTPGLPVQAAVRYVAARSQVEVGGDWFDVFRSTETGETVLVVGDVAGHDLAAATRMAALRNLLRGVLAATDLPVDGVVAVVDRNLSPLGVAGTASAVVMTVRPDADGAWALTWTNAGHMPPLVLSPDGTVTVLDAVHGPILGTGAGVIRTRSELRVPAGATVVLYTDGLVETRDGDLGDGIAALADTVRAAADRAGDPSRLLDELLRTIGPGDEDDTAILVCRLPPPDTD